MTASELRQRLRDRSVVIFAVLVPLALMVVLNFTFGGVADLDLDQVDVAVSAPEGDPLAATLVDRALEAGGVDVAARHVDEAEARRLAEDGEANLAMIVPAGFGEAVRGGAGVEVEMIEGEGAGIETDIVISVVQAVLDQFRAGAVAAIAGLELGLAPDEVGELAEAAATAGPAIELVEGTSSTEQLSVTGALVAGQAGLFLLFTVGFGVLGLLTEREQGTLARLRSMPVRPGLIVASKGLVSYILGVSATAVLLTAGSLLFDVSFGSPVVVAPLVLGAVAAGTSLMFVIARLARTAEQAGILQSILALVLGIAGGAFVTITLTGWAGRLLDLNPVAAFTRGLGISAGGGGLGDIGGPMAVLVGFTLVCLVGSRLVPDRGSSW